MTTVKSRLERLQWFITAAAASKGMRAFGVDLFADVVGMLLREEIQNDAKAHPGETSWRARAMRVGSMIEQFGKEIQAFLETVPPETDNPDAPKE